MQDLKTDNFDSAVSKGTVLVDFWAPWCGPCKAMGPVLSALEKENPTVIVAKVNIDNEVDLAARYGIRSLPTFVVFKDGAKTGQVIGMQSKDQLLALLK